MHEGQGEGSCFLNAALQALFACVSVRRVLARLYERNQASYATDLWRVETDILGRPREESPSSRLHDDRLAVTCRAVFEEPLTRVHTPRLMVGQLYNNVQEDAAESIVNAFLDASQSLAFLSSSVALMCRPCTAHVIATAVQLIRMRASLLHPWRCHC